MTNGVKRFVDCALTIEQEQELCIKYKEGARPSQLMSDFDITGATYQRILRAYKIPTRHKRTYLCNETFFDSIDTESKAYFLGLLSADGYIQSNGKRHVVQLFMTDRDIVIRLRDELGSTYRIYDVDLSKWNGKPGFMLTIGSKYMVNTLITHGLGPGRRKGNKSRFAQFIPFSLIHHYIRGLFDGDGSVGMYKRRKFPSLLPQAHWSLTGSVDIVRGVQAILANTCNLSFGKIRLVGNYYILQYGGNRQVSRIGDFLYRDATIFLNRKYDMFPLRYRLPLLPR